jgi:predicted transcriptional regulator YdeE
VLVNSILFAQNGTNGNETTNFIEEHMTKYEIVQKPAILVIGIDCQTSNAPEAGPHDIPKLWQRFYCEDVMSQIPNKISNEVIALYCDYEGDFTQPYSFVIGCQVSSIDYIPEGLAAKIIPGSSYAVFHAIGEFPASLIETWGNIWKEPNLQRTYLGDFELYGEKFTSGTPQEVEVYIGIDNKDNNL